MDRKIISPFILLVSILCAHSFGQVSVTDDIYSNEIITDTIEQIVPEAHYTEIILDSVIHAGDDLAEVIGRQPGIMYKKDGATGSRSTISIRGVDSRKVLIYLDGIPLNSAMGESVDLSRINPEIIESIEIYKSYIPAKYGGNGFGGVINLKKKKHVKDGKSVELSTTIGSFGEKKVHVGGWYVPHYLFDVYSTVDFTYAENDYPYLDRNHTPYNSIDDTVRVVENDNFQSFEFQFRPTLALKDGKAILAELQMSRVNDQIPALNGYENKTALQEIDETNFRLVFSNPDSEKIVKVTETLLSYNNQKKSIFWSHLDNFGIAHGSLNDGEWARLSHNDYKVNLKSSFTIEPNKYFLLETSAFVDYKAYLPESDIYEDITGDWECFRLSGKLSSDFRIKTSYFTSYIGGTIDAYMDSTNGGWNEYLNYDLESEREYTTVGSWRLGANAFLLGKNLSFFMNGGRYFKVATLREKFGFKGAVAPNPELKDEEQYSFEVGLELNSRLVKGESSFFYLKSNNGIVFISDGFLIRPVNLVDDKIYGGELALTWNLHEKITATTNFTLQKSVLNYPGYEGNLKPGQPPFYMDLGLQLGSFYGLSILWDLTYKARFFRDPENNYPEPVHESKVGFGFNAFGLKLVKKRLVLQAYVKNLPLNIFNFDLYGDYALEHLNDAPNPNSGGGYYWDDHPGIKYHFKIGFSF